MEQLHLLGS